VSEADFGFVALLSDFKGDFCAIPLALVFNKIKLAVYDKPNNFFCQE